MKRITIAIFLTLCFIGTIYSACGDKCADSTTCNDGSNCRLCLDGTCQHRCPVLETNNQPFKFLAGKCGDACSSSSDCGSDNCLLCLDSTCQHRCPIQEEIDVPLKGSDCDSTCLVCVWGTCKQRISGNEDAKSEIFELMQ